jgi:hypothetical protein
VSDFLSVFQGVSSVSTRDVEGPGDCESGVFRVEEVDGFRMHGVMRYHRKRSM